MFRWNNGNIIIIAIAGQKLTAKNPMLQAYLRRDLSSAVSLLSTFCYTWIYYWRLRVLKYDGTNGIEVKTKNTVSSSYSWLMIGKLGNIVVEDEWDIYLYIYWSDDCKTYRKRLDILWQVYIYVEDWGGGGFATFSLSPFLLLLNIVRWCEGSVQSYEKVPTFYRRSSPPLSWREQSYIFLFID